MAMAIAVLKSGTLNGLLLVRDLVKAPTLDGDLSGEPSGGFDGDRAGDLAGDCGFGKRTVDGLDGARVADFRRPGCCFYCRGAPPFLEGGL